MNAKIVEMNNMNDTVENTSSSIHNAIDHTSDAIHPAVDQVVSGVHKAVDKLANVASQAADTLELKSGKIKEVQSRFNEGCRTQIRYKPLATLGVAVAAGFLVSWLLRQR
jgi:ElaB/YqjD/DUF883 family membrane-anchored ribosome-binding protein